MESFMTYKVGDVVLLKSGGPKMTVIAVHDDAMVYTSWFAGAKNERAHFDVSALELAKNDV
jgi:uncharacterized protein YodC (DUF2158 family)